MNMVRHYNVTKQIKPFVGYTKFQTIDDNLKIFFLRKNMEPGDDSSRRKIQIVLRINFAPFHDQLR